MQNTIKFLHKVGQLKNVIRFEDAKDMVGDSAAEHSWRAALMTFVLADELKIEIDKTKALEMALIHDIVESMVGNTDYTSIVNGKITKEQQSELENKAINDLKELAASPSGDKIFALWKEYDEASTKEAKFIKAINKLETFMYLIETGYEGYDQPEAIANYADKAVSVFPELKDILKELKNEMKEEFKKGGFDWKEEFDNI